MQFMNTIKGGKQTSLFGQNSRGKTIRTILLDSGVSGNHGRWGAAAVGCGSAVTLRGARSHKSQYH